MSIVGSPKKREKKTSAVVPFKDGLTNVFNSLVNKRSASASNDIVANQITWADMNACYKNGIGNKIVRVKAGKALNNTLQFSSMPDGEAYNSTLAKHVKSASKLMLAFGRSVIMIHNEGDDLSKPLGNFDRETAMIKVFDGSIVAANSPDTNINSKYYQQPRQYSIRGYAVHPSRIIDFTYVNPIETDLPAYQYGGISEYELIYSQLVNDSIVERASSSILEKSSNMVYKVKGFKDAMRAKRDSELIEYFSTVEDMRGLYGAVILDEEDSAEVLTQTLTNLSETDLITLRRLAMVTGLSFLTLVGEGPNGMNSNGDQEAQVSQDTIEALQSDYLIEPIRQLCELFGIDGVSFKDGQGGSPGDRAHYEKVVLENATALAMLGGDWSLYLESKGVVAPDDWSKFWGDE